MDTIPHIFQKYRNKIMGIPDPERSNLCCYPFMQVLMTANGRYRPCCKFKDYITDKGEILEVGKASAGDAWNADSMQDLRARMLDGKRHSGCGECWKEEQAGIKSMRYDSFQYPVTRQQLREPRYPLRVEINASNVCNLKCRICSSWASTKWIAEEQSVYGFSEEKHINLNPENMEVIKSWLPHLREIGLFGGEPLLSEENLDLLRYCISSGEARHLTLLINTNTTVYTDEIVSIFKGFKKVYLNFSIDDIGKRFEYQRKGAKWEDSISIIRKFLEHGGFSNRNRIVCKINCTISNLNVYYLPEFFDYFNSHFPGLPVFINLLYNPAAFSIQALPQPVKAIIGERLKQQVRTSYNTHELYTKTIDSVIRFMEDKTNSTAGDFQYVIEKHDQYRNERFAETFPEFQALLAQYAVAEKNP